MKISIIIPVYNAEKYINKCADIIKSQSFKNWEVVFVDDGSTDDSVNICKSIIKNDSRFKLFCQKNAGPGASRNTGIDNATGDYITFVDADDYISDDFLQKMADKMVQNKFDLAVCGYRDFDIVNGQEKQLSISVPTFSDFFGDEVQSKFFMLFEKCFIIAPWAKLYKMSIIKENNIKFPLLKRLEDPIFNMDYYKHCNSVGFINYIGYNYYRPGKMLQKLPSDYFDIWVAVCNKLETTFNNIDKEKNIYPILMQQLYICLKTNYLGVWSNSKKEQRNYTVGLLAKTEVDMIKGGSYKRKHHKILQILIAAKNEIFIKWFIKTIIFYQKHC